MDNITLLRSEIHNHEEQAKTYKEMAVIDPQNKEYYQEMAKYHLLQMSFLQSWGEE